MLDDLLYLHLTSGQNTENPLQRWVGRWSLLRRVIDVANERRKV